MVHVKYPSMERQDLTQGQLGSFKFTPVDEAPRHSPYPHPLLASRWAHLSQDGNPPGIQHSQQPHAASDPSFFNRQIRPALDQSRLRLGPAAVRAAVESASPSPQKQRSQSLVQDHLQGNVPAFFPHQFNSSEHDSLPSLYMTETQSSDMGLTQLDSLYGVSPSILCALQNEQDAHNSTKTLLDTETTLREEAEATIKQLQIHNQSLLNSIKLLQSTVKHMVQKENNPIVDADKVLEHAVDEFNKEAKNNKADHSILYENLSQGVDDKKPNIQNGDHQFMNSEFHLRESVQMSDYADKPEPRNDTAMTSDMQANGASDRYQRIPVTAVFDDDDDDDAKSEPDVPALEKKMVDFNVRGSRPPSPMLELPAEFIEKYGKGPIKKEQPEDGESDTPQLLIDKGYTIEPKSVNLLAPIVCSVPKVTETNIYRTVMIDNIPIGAKYIDVLAHVRGGTLESIQLYGPIGKCTNFFTARVVFTHEVGALTLYQHGQNPGIKIDGRPLRVWHILEPTYPKNTDLEKAIYEENYTRILIVNAPHIDDIDNRLKRKLHQQVQAGSVLDISRSFEGLPMVEFTSIEEAMKALRTLMLDAGFGGTCFDFEDDYCAARYAA